MVKYIAGRSGRERLLKELERIHHAVRPYILVYITDADHVEVKGYDHQMILDVIKLGDKKKALHVMKTHLGGIVANLVEYMRGKRSSSAPLAEALPALEDANP